MLIVYILPHCVELFLVCAVTSYVWLLLSSLIVFLRSIIIIFDVCLRVSAKNIEP